MKFLKMHGLGNDFVILDQREGKKELKAAEILQLADRHFGVGCDQVLVMEPSEKADFFMRVYNVDASEAEACGNGTRCVAHLYMSEQGTEICAVETLGGVLEAKLCEDGLVSVDMGPPQLEWQDIGLASEIDTLHLPVSEGPVSDPVAVGMGNPHCVFFVESLTALDIETLAPKIENHLLYPEKTNVEFVVIREDGRLRVRTWERGAGLTLACGSGACAAAVAAMRREVAPRKIELILDGGPITIAWRESDGHVLMTGPVAYVFDGTLKNI